MFQRRPINVPKLRPESTFSGSPQDVNFEHKYKTHFCISANAFQILAHQMFVLKTKKLVITYSFSLGETP